MNEIEELKSKIQSTIINREVVPEELIEIIEDAYKGMIEKYEEYGYDNDTILEYIEGKSNEVKNYIQKQFEEDRQDEYIYQAQYIVRKIESDLEENKEEEEKRRDEERYKQGFSEIKSDNIKDTRNIISILDETLREIQSVQNRILDARGYDENMCEELHSEIISYITKFGIQNEENIYNILEKEDGKVVQKLLNEYEEYLTYIGKSKQEKFRDSLKIDTSLEEQNKTSKEIIEKMEQEKPQQTEKSMLQIDLL